MSNIEKEYVAIAIIVLVLTVIHIILYVSYKKPKFRSILV